MSLEGGRERSVIRGTFENTTERTRLVSYQNYRD